MLYKAILTEADIMGLINADFETSVLLTFKCMKITPEGNIEVEFMVNGEEG